MGPHSMLRNRVPMEREASSPEPLVCSSIYICQESPILCPPTKNGENIWSSSMEPHVDRRPTYNGVPPGSPRGSFITTLQSLPQCHAAFSTIPSTLAWVDQSPVSQRVVATPIRVCPPQLLPPPM